jgi:hypothetical protein
MSNWVGTAVHLARRLLAAVSHLAAACMMRNLSDPTDITTTQARAVDATPLGGDAAGLVEDGSQ